ncbi:FAD-dependent monooxygenase [Streptomyces sp. NPDC087901]|uniref:FAD-dependent monooxygenase n=1 Tax=Streptomyces sp. NPDC087901 TaxID=3365818 RepID=UPI003821ED18
MPQADVIVIGAGPVGLTTAMLLAEDGVSVTVLERDDAGPSGADAARRAWREWRRPGVNQFRQPHILLPSGFAVLCSALPRVVAELQESGALPLNILEEAWRAPAIGGRRPGDERYDTLTARRPVLEAAFAATAARTPGVTVRRTTVVSSLLAGAERLPGSPHVIGVTTQDGEEIHAPLVVDAGGRDSPVGALLARLGGPPPASEQAEAGFIYYSRSFRSVAGTPPGPALWQLIHHDGVSSIVLPGDGGTWSLSLVASSRDRALRVLQDPQAWQQAVALFPMLTGRMYGEPLTGVQATSGLDSRSLRTVVEGAPVVTGLLSVGDARATTDPQFGLGLSLGLTHARVLSQVIGATGTHDSVELALRFDEATERTIMPVYRRLRDWDTHRLAEIDALLADRRYETNDPGWNIGNALDALKLSDPDVLRAMTDVACGLADPDSAFSAPAVRGKALAESSGSWPRQGPARAEVLAAVRTVYGSSSARAAPTDADTGTVMEPGAGVEMDRTGFGSGGGHDGGE